MSKKNQKYTICDEMKFIDRIGTHSPIKKYKKTEKLDLLKKYRDTFNKRERYNFSKEIVINFLDKKIKSMENSIKEDLLQFYRK